MYDKMKYNQKQLFNITKITKHNINLWTVEQKIKLHKVELVGPFVEIDCKLHVVFFFDSDKSLNEYAVGETNEIIKKQFLSELQSNGYPEDLLKLVTFEYDSHENVVKNYEGNYFYRMR